MTRAADERELETWRVVGMVRDELKKRDVDCVLIGALALAHHGYVRATEDVDLAVRSSLDVLEIVADEMRSRGLEANLVEPDGDDPLGGVLTVTGRSFDPVQVVNFEGRFPRLVDDAIARGPWVELSATRLQVTDLETLILFKLYAGGLKSAADVLELLSRHPELDLGSLRDRARTVRLEPELERLLSLR